MVMESVIEQKVKNIDFSDNTAIADCFNLVLDCGESQQDIEQWFGKIRDFFAENDQRQKFADFFSAMCQAKREEVRKNYRFELRYFYDYFDFTQTNIPYEDVFRQPNSFARNIAIEIVGHMAKKCGFSGFKKSYEAYEKSLVRVNESSEKCQNPTDFPYQPIELEAGEWLCNFSGVSRLTLQNREVICPQPVMPVERLVNIDTGEEKLKIAFFKGDRWREFTAGKRDLFDSSKVLKFASLGLAVTSKNAKLFSDYICGIENLNTDRIPEKQSVSRLGYIGENFAPYVDGEFPTHLQFSEGVRRLSEMA